jgi:HPt (histidine-containing phosphotransfer) domain-containing protein
MWTVPDYMEDLYTSQPDIWLELVELYLKDASSSLATLEEQLLHADSEAAARTLHSLKGSSKQIGGLAVGERSAQIEDEVSRGEWHAARQAFPGLSLAFQSLHREMEEAICALANRRRAI